MEFLCGFSKVGFLENYDFHLVAAVLKEKGKFQNFTVIKFIKSSKIATLSIYTFIPLGQKIDREEHSHYLKKGGVVFYPEGYVEVKILRFSN